MKLKTVKDLTSLNLGDTIRHVTGGDVLIVTYRGGDFLIATRTQHVSNPDEWEVVVKDGQRV